MSDISDGTESSKSRSQNKSLDSSSVMTNPYSDKELVSGAVGYEWSTTGSASSRQDVTEQSMAEQERHPVSPRCHPDDDPYTYHIIDYSVAVRDFISDSDIKEICETPSGDGIIMPRSMEAHLRKRHEHILPRIQSICDIEDFVYVSQGLAMSLKLPISRFPTSLVCDVCIYSKCQPVMILTIVSDTSNLSKAETYNAQLAKQVNTATRKKCPNFTVTYGVMHTERFTSDSLFKEEIVKLKKQSSIAATGGSLLMSESKFTEAVRVFLEMLGTCYHVKAQSEQPEDTTVQYFNQHMFILLCEVFEDRRHVSIQASSVDSAMVLLKEMVIRFSSMDKSNITIQCAEKHLPQMEQFQKHGKITKFESTGSETPSTTADIVLTTSSTENPRWDFTIKKDSATTQASPWTERRRDEGNEETRKVEEARKIIASSIMEELTEIELTKAEKQELEETLNFSLTQFEMRAAIFLKDHLHDKRSIDEIKYRSRFMEDYLMQCFRQREVQLTQTNEIKSGKPLLSEDHHQLAKQVENEMEQLENSSKTKEICPFCKMKEIVDINELAEALHQTNKIPEKLKENLTTSSQPNTQKWSKLFEQVKCVESIKTALELVETNKDVRLELSCIECTCNVSESAFVGSEGKEDEDDVANMKDVSD